MTDRQENRPRRLSDTFLHLSGVLTEEYDLAGVLQIIVNECALWFDCVAGCIQLRTDDGSRLAAGVPAGVEFDRLWAIDQTHGPSQECFTSGDTIQYQSAALGLSRWSTFHHIAVSLAISTHLVIPLRVREDVLGVLALSRRDGQLFFDHDLDVAATFSNFATLAITNHGRLSDARATVGQLQHALTSRLIIEQAKGAVAENTGQDVETAFTAIRRHARRNGISIHSLAASITSGETSANLRSA